MPHPERQSVCVDYWGAQRDRRVWHAQSPSPVADFMAVLGLSSDVADAVVAYRLAQGRFADRDALLKVPGLDRSRLERLPTSRHPEFTQL